MSLLVILLVLVLALSVLLVVPREAPPARRSLSKDDIDEEVLGQAEAELENLRSTASPDDADDDLPDWGPGAPKQTFGPRD